MRIPTAVIAITFLMCISSRADDRSNHVLLSAPIDPTFSGKEGSSAYDSVMRLFCINNGTYGSAFIYNNNSAITAAHVVKGCSPLILLTHSGEQIPCTIHATDDEIDIAVVTLSKAVTGIEPLDIYDGDDVKIGTEVSTWGYPAGYAGIAPLLSIGYLAGLDGIHLDNGKTEARWIVNGAFNSGNSGGPLLQFDTGKVIGIVSSKLAPISTRVKQIIDVLNKEPNGFMYTETLPDGTKKQVSQANLIAIVMEELRGQVQLVIGYAVTTKDLRKFLQDNKVDEAAKN
jgi:S1-C subfamily serine protease